MSRFRHVFLRFLLADSVVIDLASCGAEAETNQGAFDALLVYTRLGWG